MSTLDEGNYGNELIEAGVLQRLQDFFCRANDMYLTCLDGGGTAVTEAYGSEEELNYIHRLVDEIDYRQLVRRTGADPVVNIQEKALDERYVRLCGIAGRMEGGAVVIWIAFAILEEKITEHDDVPEYMARTTEERFYRSMEFLEMLSGQILLLRAKELSAQEESRKSLEAAEEIERSLHRSESMTEVARSLESGQAFGAVAEQVIRETCETLDIAGGCLLCESSGGEDAEVVCEYAGKEGAAAGLWKGRGLRELPFYDGKPYMISASSTKPSSFVRLFDECGIEAAVFLPVRADSVLMYLCFYETEYAREWAVPDIRFINDVKHVVQSILTKRLADRSMAGSRASMEAILENAGCGIYVVDYGSRQTLYTNQKFKELFAATIASGHLEELLLSEQETERVRYYGEVYVEQEGRWLDVCKTVIRWVDGRNVNLCTLYDITDKKNCQKELEGQENHDFLNGLSGRMRCEQALEGCLVQAQSAESEGALLYLDLDDFGQIDGGAGQVLLRAVAQGLSEIRGVEHSCYRTGSDEFMIIVPDGEYGELERIVAEIGSIFLNPWSIKGEDFYCTMSMGVVRFPSDGDSVKELIKRADLALLEAKQRGKNCVEYYRDKPQRHDLEKHMRTAAVNACSEFEVYYQPLISASQEMPCCGAQALVRWNSGAPGTIVSDDFLPLAEYLDLVNPVGEYVLKKAAKRCRRWNDMGHPEYGVNVKLSAVQLMQKDIVKRIRGVIRETKLQPQNLTLELTESLAVNDRVRMKRVLSEIRSLGVKVALNDFGTGRASFLHIRELPVDIIRIDRSFSEHLGEDDFSDAFVRMVSQLAATLGVRVCVKGIETAKQMEAASQMNVSMLQGNYFGKPMPIEAFEAKYL